MRFGLGPVFAYEWLTTARSWRVYAMRVLFGLGLLGILWMVASSGPSYLREGGTASIQQQAEAGRAFAATIIATQLGLMLLIAPAATAGTLCLDKARGTLAHVFATDLTNAEVILGKLCARLLPCLGLMFSTLGLMAICTLMGGIDPRALTGAMLVTLGVTVLGASLSLLISVWAGKVHEVVMASYLILVTWLLAYPVWWTLGMMPATRGMFLRAPDWLKLANPFILLFDVRPGEYPVGPPAWFLLGCLVVASAFMALAVLKVRSAAIHQMNKPATPRRKRWFAKKQPAAAGRVVDDYKPRDRRWLWWRGPSIERNPVLWREWHRTRPSRWTRAIWWFYTLGCLGFSTLGFYLILTSPGPNNGSMEVALVAINGFEVALGLLLVSVSAATSLADERTRGSLDVLLTTSLPTSSIVWGKWWGAFRVVPGLAILPCALAVCALWNDPQQVAPIPGWTPGWTVWLSPVLILGLTLAYGAAIVSFGLVMATWIARQDRAVMSTVFVYLMVTVAYPIAIGLLMDHEPTPSAGLVCASPFMGIAMTGERTIQQGWGEDLWGLQLAWSTFWILMNITFAALLMKLELSRFNLKFGRTPDAGIRQRPTPPLPDKPDAVLTPELAMT